MKESTTDNMGEFITITNAQKLANYDELKKENERLKKQLEYLRNEEYLRQVKWERDFNEKLVNDYKSRIDKAYNYVSKCEYELLPANVGWVNDLKNILKGENNE